MGRMKELYMELLHANDGYLPLEATIADLQRMDDLKIFEWKEYEQQQEKIREQFNQSENPGEIRKIEQVQKKFSKEYGKSKDQRSEQ
jgi:hypothetical protein